MFHKIHKIISFIKKLPIIEREREREAQATLLEEGQEILPINNLKLLAVLDNVSEDFWNKYDKQPISFVSSGIINNNDSEEIKGVILYQHKICQRFTTKIKSS
ncbi:hypothetical protein RCL_jg5714.t1 [Rhizophagus clarus]|uniref:Uncharacterized protein n=1 Tax=Rhizophagus clarus TaxID=94130 RepID=A0A8H3M797_9GLOM|nr:hypothetical protein RCL_jg5714.t1 [Rhizophagus clarus]